MKAEIINGTLVLIPDNQTEEYAAKQWLAMSSLPIPVEDLARMEKAYIRGTALRIAAPLTGTYIPPGA